MVIGSLIEQSHTSVQLTVMNLRCINYMLKSSNKQICDIECFSSSMASAQTTAGLPVQSASNVTSPHTAIHMPQDNSDYHNIGFAGGSTTNDPFAMLFHQVLTLTDLCQEIKSSQDTLKTTLLQKIEECKVEVIRGMDAKMDTLRRDVSHEVSRLTTRVERMETKVQDIVDDDNFNPARTLVVTRLNTDSDKSPLDQAQALMHDGLGLDTPVVRAKRLQGRNGKPGILKAELPSTDHKVEALRRKQNLMGNRRYSNVYVRSSQTHEERVMQTNMRLVLDAIPELSGRYRFAGNGRLVEKTVRNRDGGPNGDAQRTNPVPVPLDPPPPSSNPDGPRYYSPDPGYAASRTALPPHTMDFPPQAPQPAFTPRPPHRYADPRRLAFH